MDKSKVTLFMLSPIIIGILFNYLIMVPVLGAILMYCGPIFFILYWGKVGGIFSEYMKNSFKATLLANLGGITSLVIYIWQFIFVADDNRNILLAGLSQAFSAPLIILTARIGALFEKEPNAITMNTILVAEIVGFLLMMVIFFIGFRMKKKQRIL